MRTLVRFLILLGLVIWVGGLLFFGAVLAPVAFGSLMPMFPDPAFGVHIAGTMVRVSLLRLHDIGLIVGVILLLLCIVERVARLTRRTIVPQLVLLAVMIGLTAYSQFSVIPRMQTLRMHSGTGIASLPRDNPTRQNFDRLHNLTTQLEGAVIVCGLVLLVLFARPEPSDRGALRS